MTDLSGPWDGAAWAEANWYLNMTEGLPSGVAGSPAASASAGGLGFTSSGLAVTLAAGAASVGGAAFSRTGTPSSTAVTTNGNATLARRDRIVLRRDLGTHSVYPVVIAGTPASNPSPPNIVRTSTQWDLKMFSFLVPANNGTSISGVVDERVWLSQGVVTDPANPKFQCGSTGVSLSVSNSDSGTVTFPTPFATAPIVDVGIIIEDGANIDLIVDITGDPTASSFNWRARERGGNAVTVTAKMTWMAALPS